jgi:hypothetical protein
VLTLNHATGLSEWQSVERVARFDVTDLETVLMEGISHSSLSTLDHRWPILTQGRRRVFRRTGQLKVSDRIVTAAPCADQPTEANWTDELVELVAWYWTEGSISKAKNQVVIAQSHTVNPGNVAQIRACLTRLFGPMSEGMRTLPYVTTGASQRGCSEDGCSRPHYGRGMCRMHHKRWWRKAAPAREERVRGPEDRGAGWREWQSIGGSGRPITRFQLSKAVATQLDAIAPGKRVSLSFIRELTPTQLELFIRISMLADGQHRHGRDITQRIDERLDAIELAGILRGRMTSRASYVEGTGYRAGRPAEQHRVNLSERTEVMPVKAAYEAARLGHPGMQIKRVTYTGTIWCPVTVNGTWLARRKGKVFYTGQLGLDAILELAVP